MARDYFGNDPSTGQQVLAEPQQLSKDDEPPSESQPPISEKEQQARLQQAELTGQFHKEEKVTEHNAAIHTRNHKGEFTSAVHEGIDSPSQTAMLAALTQQSALRAKNKPPLIAFHDLDQDRWDEELCTKPGIDGADPFQYNVRRLYCPREGCGSLILNAGSGDMVIDDTVVSVLCLTFPVVSLTFIMRHRCQRTSGLPSNLTQKYPRTVPMARKQRCTGTLTARLLHLKISGSPGLSKASTRAKTRVSNG